VDGLFAERVVGTVRGCLPPKAGQNLLNTRSGFKSTEPEIMVFAGTERTRMHRARRKIAPRVWSMLRRGTSRRFTVQIKHHGRGKQNVSMHAFSRAGGLGSERFSGFALFSLGADLTRGVCFSRAWASAETCPAPHLDDALVVVEYAVV